MVEELLASVAQLRGNAQDLRRNGRGEFNHEKRTELFERAAKEFSNAIIALERGLRTLQRHQSGYTRDVCRVLEALSQSYGSLGGTFRDAGDLTKARDSYDRGNQYEQERRMNCAARDTYNMLQRLIIRLLIDPTLLRQNSFATDLDIVKQEITRQVTAGRNDSWALADLALVQFLSGTDDNAVMDNLEKGQAEATFYESTYNAVAALTKEGLGKGHELGERLEAFKRLLQRKGGLAG